MITWIFVIICWYLTFLMCIGGITAMDKIELFTFWGIIISAIIGFLTLIIQDYRESKRTEKIDDRTEYMKPVLDNVKNDTDKIGDLMQETKILRYQQDQNIDTIDEISTNVTKLIAKSEEESKIQRLLNREDRNSHEAIKMYADSMANHIADLNKQLQEKDQTIHQLSEKIENIEEFYENTVGKSLKDDMQNYFNNQYYKRNHEIR